MKTIIRSVLLPTFLSLAAVAPKTQAVVPAPDGCYPNFTTAEGCDALSLLTSGAANTGLGWRSLFSDSTGSFNTGIGAGALVLNNGDSNTAVGAAALLLNTNGTQNTAVGTGAMVFNDSGEENNAVGAFALFNNIDGSANNAFGNTALRANITGSSNTAIGNNALFSNDSSGNGTANSNTAVGAAALINNIDGNSNTAVGAAALANSTGSGSIGIGSNAGAFVGSSNNVIAIGSPGDDVDNSCFIGNIRDIQTQNADAIAVVVDSAGQLGTISSSRRFKKEIEPMDKTSEAIHALKPVTFHYKSDKTDTPQFGLIAEEVAAVNPNLVVRDEKEEIYTVRYDAVNAMLLNEFLKEHRQVEEQNRKLENQTSKIQQQETTIAQLKKDVETLIARVAEQNSKIQRVSDQVELNKAAPQLAAVDE